jgi:hypothetical protein
MKFLKINTIHRKQIFCSNVYKHIKTDLRNEAMTKYNRIKTNFEQEYRAFIDSYISESMTLHEEQSIRDLHRQETVNYSDMHKLVKNTSTCDSTGWLVKKCKFVEEYISRAEINNSQKNTQTICCMDSTTDAGIAIYCEIMKEEYSELVMQYRLTKLEQTHLGTHASAMVLDFALKHRQLETVSGIDSSGWLNTKKIFARERSANHHHAVSSTADAVLEVLQKVKKNVQNELYHSILESRTA